MTSFAISKGYHYHKTRNLSLKLFEPLSRQLQPPPQAFFESSIIGFCKFFLRPLSSQSFWYLRWTSSDLDRWYRYSSRGLAGAPSPSASVMSFVARRDELFLNFWSRKSLCLQLRTKPTPSEERTKDASHGESVSLFGG